MLERSFSNHLKYKYPKKGSATSSTLARLVQNTIRLPLAIERTQRVKKI